MSSNLLSFIPPFTFFPSSLPNHCPLSIYFQSNSSIPTFCHSFLHALLSCCFASANLSVYPSIKTSIHQSIHPSIHPHNQSLFPPLSELILPYLPLPLSFMTRYLIKTNDKRSSNSVPPFSLSLLPFILCSSPCLSFILSLYLPSLFLRFSLPPSNPPFIFSSTPIFLIMF